MDEVKYVPSVLTFTLAECIPTLWDGVMVWRHTSMYTITL